MSTEGAPIGRRRRRRLKLGGGMRNVSGCGGTVMNDVATGFRLSRHNHKRCRHQFLVAAVVMNDVTTGFRLPWHNHKRCRHQFLVAAVQS
ncbi:hypothetical protein EVAR_78944_1 [Eumeta japonica]|uniref:Uncharacterized protein n=1 Tax=Eumeta variegata TaxID=151549 RepID=A0A4C1U2I1_EUMVA|nr:hypothetical protein EVAR_78944_1 [Eumeta japonica]